MTNKKYHQEYSKKHYEANKEKYKARSKDRYARYLEIIQTIKSEIGCQYCKFNEHPRALEFHHYDTNKENHISHIRSFTKVIKEIKKCWVLCANCHRLFHAGVISLEKIDNNAVKNLLTTNDKYDIKKSVPSFNG